MYFNYIENNNIIYSIDKIRLKTYISYSLFTELQFRFDTCWKDSLKYFYTSCQTQQYYYNYVVKTDDKNSFWFGFLHNTEKRDIYTDKYSLTIEFNPNKIKDNFILLYLLNLSGNWYVRGYDLACDLKINILDIIFDRGLKRSYKIFSNGFDDKTIYIGKNNGRIKIYNKKRESNLDIVGDLTRVEISNQLDNFDISTIKTFKYPDNFPLLYLNNYLYTFKDYDDKTLLAVLYAVQNNFPVNNLSRVYRKKVKGLLEGGCSIKFDNKSATMCFNKTIFHYFMSNSKVRWK